MKRKKKPSKRADKDLLIPVTLLRRSAHSGASIYAVLCRLAGRNSLVTKRLDQVANQCDWSESYLAKGLAWLEKHKYIEILPAGTEENPTNRDHYRLLPKRKYLTISTAALPVQLEGEIFTTYCYSYWFYGQNGRCPTEAEILQATKLSEAELSWALMLLNYPHRRIDRRVLPETDGAVIQVVDPE